MQTKCPSIAPFHRPIHSHWSLPLRRRKRLFPHGRNVSPMQSVRKNFLQTNVTFAESRLCFVKDVFANNRLSLLGKKFRKQCDFFQVVKSILFSYQNLAPIQTKRKIQKMNEAPESRLYFEEVELSLSRNSAPGQKVRNHSKADRVFSDRC